MPPEIQQGRADDDYRPFQLIGVILLALLGFAVFFLSFLLAPLLILVLFYVGFSTADRNKRDAKSNGNADQPAPAPAPAPPASTAPLTQPPGTLTEPRPVPSIMVTPGPNPR